MSENLLDDFDIIGLDLNNTVVRCETQEEADIFLDYLRLRGVWDEHGVKALSEQWKKFRNLTCYHISKHSWCYDSYYAQNNPEYHIVDFCDIYKPMKAIGCKEIGYYYDDLFGVNQK